MANQQSSNWGPVSAWVVVGITLVGVIVSQAITQTKLAAGMEANANSIHRLEQGQAAMVEILSSQAVNEAQHQAFRERMDQFEEHCCGE